MADRPILFNDEMVRAILDGRKTQTRRPFREMNDAKRRGAWQDAQDWVPTRNGFWATSSGLPLGPFKPPCVEGDRLWVREAFNYVEGEGISYRATNPEMNGLPWKPSIHMPRWASRITLEVIDVRVNRLQEISAKDVWAEGIQPPYYKTPGTVGGDWTALVCLQELWDSIYAKRGLGWGTNPWVWVTEFRLAKVSIGHHSPTGTRTGSSEYYQA